MFCIATAPNGVGAPDIFLDDMGNLAANNDSKAIAEHIRARLMFYQGEWFLDKEAGVPWFNEILGGAFDPTLAESVIKNEILATPGVSSITYFDIGFDRQPRHLRVNRIEVKTIYDETVRI